MAAKRREAAPRAERAPTKHAPSAGASQAQAGASPVLVGRLLAGSTPASPLVDFPGNAAGPVRARTTLAIEAAVIDRAVVTGQGVVLVFENGDVRLPIVTGLIWSGQVVTPFQELLVSPRAASEASRGAKAPFEARLDGDRVVLEAKREVILKCGEASITLRSDGRMVLRGAHVETYAKGLNRIKGGSVKIN